MISDLIFLHLAEPDEEIAEDDGQKTDDQNAHRDNPAFLPRVL